MEKKNCILPISNSTSKSAVSALEGAVVAMFVPPGGISTRNFELEDIFRTISFRAVSS